MSKARLAFLWWIVISVLELAVLQALWAPVASTATTKSGVLDTFTLTTGNINPQQAVSPQ